MSRPTGKNWKLIGKVGVDSGQLMICDPCYIDGHWIPNTKPQGHPAMVLTPSGKKKFPENKDWSWRFNLDDRYDTPQPALGGLSINDAREQGYITEVPNAVINEFSYRGVCSQTIATTGAVIGKGTAAAFRSGYGDGLYEVWGRTNKDGRVMEVRILMD